MAGAAPLPPPAARTAGKRRHPHFRHFRAGGRAPAPPAAPGTGRDRGRGGAARLGLAEPPGPRGRHRNGSPAVPETSGTQGAQPIHLFRELGRNAGRPKGFSSCQDLPFASLLKLQHFSWRREALELLLCFARPDYMDHIDWSQQLCSCKDQLNIRGSLGSTREQHSPLYQLNMVAQDTDFAVSVIKYVSALGLILFFMRSSKTISKDNCPMRSFLH
nr:uncharacterized protein LOC121470752 [Taeniopygia guttata]